MNILQIYVAFFLTIYFQNIYTDSYRVAQRSVEDEKFIEEFVNGLNITDDIDHQAVLTHLEYCPNSELCEYSTETLKEHFKDDMTTTCCAPCSCEEICVKRGNCCPDKYKNLTLKLDKYIIQQIYKCIYTKYTSSTKWTDKDDSVWAVSRCSNPTDAFVVEKCENVTMDVFNYETHIPVTDITTGTIYRNINCATCNDVDGRDIDGWSVQLNCAGTLAVDISLPNFENLDRRLCFLEYKSKSLLNDSTKCYAVRKVPQVYYDTTASLEGLCRLFQITFNLKYSNVFCMLRTETRTERNCEDPPPTIPFLPSNLFLIDFETLMTWTQDKKGKAPMFQITSGKDNCSSNELYEMHKQVCLPISCDENRRYRNGTCVSVFTLDPPKVYRVEFRLMSELPFHKYYLRSGFATDVKDSMTNLFYTTFKGENIHVCSLSYFASTSRDKITNFVVESALFAPTIHKDPIYKLMNIDSHLLFVNSSYYTPFQFKVSFVNDAVMNCPTDDADHCQVSDKIDGGILKVFMWKSKKVICKDADKYPVAKLNGMSFCAKSCTPFFYFRYPNGDDPEKNVCLNSSNICFELGEYQMEKSKICFCIKTYFYKLKRSQFGLRITSTSYPNRLHIALCIVSLTITDFVY